MAKMLVVEEKPMYTKQIEIRRPRWSKLGLEGEMPEVVRVGIETDFAKAVELLGDVSLVASRVMFGRELRGREVFERVRAALPSTPFCFLVIDQDLPLVAGLEGRGTDWHTVDVLSDDFLSLRWLARFLPRRAA